jgi:hypothetical protein
VKLVECGKLTLHDTRYGARRLEIQSGAERGWEVAVCDHFRAMTTAVANKVAHFGEHKKYIGGGTVSFRIDHGHPLRQRVLDQLEAVRAQVDALWREVADYNEQHGVAETFSRVTFYFGQNVVEGDSAFEVSK